MVDRRVDLDRVRGLKPEVSESIDRRGGDDADGERVLVAERAADRGNRLADANGVESPSGTGASVRLRVDPDDADVVEDVPADDRRRNAVAVLELDVDLRAPAPPPAASAAFVITCELVRIKPAASTTKPEPCEPRSAPKSA